jgi:hypothetical protein
MLCRVLLYAVNLRHGIIKYKNVITRLERSTLCSTLKSRRCLRHITGDDVSRSMKVTSNETMVLNATVVSKITVVAVCSKVIVVTVC